MTTAWTLIRVVHYTSGDDADWMCPCGWDVQDLPEGEFWTTAAALANCPECLAKLESDRMV